MLPFSRNQKPSFKDAFSTYTALSVVFVLISLVCLIAIIRIRTLADVATQQAGALGTSPSVDSVTPSNLSGTGDISLPDPGLTPNEGTEVTLYVYGSVTDPNGCANLNHIDIKAYRSGVSGGASCTPDGNDCYAATFAKGDFVCSGVEDTDASYEVSIPIKNFVDPTDGGSQYEADTWVASATVYDEDSNPDTLTNPYEVQSLGAFDLSTSALNYGTLSLGQTSTQKDVIFTNTGNRLVDAYVNANHDFQSNLSGFSDISSGAVHYSLSTGFTYGTGDMVIENEPSQTLVDINLAQQTDDLNPTTEPSYFLLQMPTEKVQGTYSNILTFTAYATPFLADTPTITLLSQDFAEQGSVGFTLDLTGSDFPSDAVVKWNGTDLETTYTDSAHISAIIPSGNLATAGTFSITVFNPGTNNSSEAVTFSVGSPAPTLDSISPSSRFVGSALFTMTLTGTNFLSTSQVKLDGSNRTTTFVSSTQLTVTIPAGTQATTSTHEITVTNPSPGGGTSSAQILEVLGRTPLISSVDPALVVVPAQTVLHITGSNFAQGEVQVYWDGNAVAGSRVTIIDSSHIDATILAGQMTQGQHTVRVYNTTYAFYSNSVAFPVGDPYTVLLLHMNGSQGDTTFLDSSISSPAHTMTSVNAIQTYATTTPNFYNDAGQFTGTTNDYIYSADSDDWYFPGDFTVDLWVNFSYVGTNNTFGIINQWNGSQGWQLSYHIYTPTNDRYFYFSANNGTTGMTFNGNYSMTVGYWHHLAVERYGNVWNMYVDGVRVGQTTNAFSMANINQSLIVGKHTTSLTEYNFRGYIDEVRVSKGIARYQGNNFTRPTEQY